MALEIVSSFGMASALVIVRLLLSFRIYIVVPKTVNALVTDYTDRDGNRVPWCPIFRRNLTKSKERNLFALLDTLHRIYVPEVGQDTMLWAPSKDGSILGGILFQGSIS